ncbi:MDR family MFS transporter [Salinibacterium sp. G-O1]|uniref:MDR family MFS transporter n=1 Tax=Salinibacterium sp. G-O1 TaxID=3046208 RepID=UPI0024B92912|nr:MDR family MFS transporter [Salinibacterium sp. G-O1]MDJ0334865.1 MDR family MFS transporter [Salinibacterium sp. G-O1]
MFTTYTSEPAGLPATPSDFTDRNFVTDNAISTDTVAGTPTPDHSKRNSLVINLMLVATFVVILNETIIGVAIPRLMEDLNISASTAQWLSTAFMLTMAVVIPTTGFIMQRLSTRTVFILAMTLFSAGTAIAAIAPGFEILLIARIVQASGTAIMMPLLMTTVMTLVPPHSRGRTMGNISLVISVAPAVGPTVSGLILSVFDWRFIFILVLPIAIAALALGAARVQNVTEPRKVPLDSLSVVLSAFAFGGLIFGLSSLGEAAAGNSVVAPWIPIAVGGVALGLFILRQLVLQRGDRAFLDLRTFKSRGFSVSIALMVMLMGALFGTIILLPIYIQDVLLLEPLQTGLILLPGSALMGVLAPFVGRLFDKVGPRPLIVPGTIVVSAALWSLAMFNENTPWQLVLVAYLGLGLGLAFTFTPLFTTSLGSLKPHLYAAGSATVATVQQLAGAAGTALFIALYTIGSLAATRTGVSETAALASGVQSAFMAGAILSLLAIVAAFFVPRPDPALAPAGAPAGH